MVVAEIAVVVVVVARVAVVVVVVAEVAVVVAVAGVAEVVVVVAGVSVANWGVSGAGIKEAFDCINCCFRRPKNSAQRHMIYVLCFFSLFVF